VSKAETQEVSKLLREYAQRTVLRGGNPYRAKAYSKAADSLSVVAIPLHRLIAEDRLTEVPGVGETIADIITKLHREGTHPSLEKLRDWCGWVVLPREQCDPRDIRLRKIVRRTADRCIDRFSERTS
jgi:DNA polymerase/3'-5' exonuclease PolX